MIRSAVVVSSAAAFVGLATLTATTGSVPGAPSAFAQAAEGAFTVDAVHSSVDFELGYGGNVGVSTGRFNEFAGSFNFDSDNPSGSSVSFTINAGSIDTNNEGRDRHLRSADFFNVGRFSAITFESTAVRSTGDDTFAVTGDLTLMGETKAITVDVTKVGEGTARGGEPAQGITAVFTITRSEYGMTYGVENGSLGDEVTITVHAYGKG